MIERLVASPWSPCQRTADVARRSRAADASRALAGVVGLELVDVVGERARRLRSPPAAARAGPARARGGRAGGRGRSASSAVEREPVDAVADRLGQAAEPRHDQRHARGEALGGGQRRAVPPHRRQRDRVDACEQPRDLARRERARELDHAAPVERAQLLGEARRGPRRGSARATRRLRALRGLDEQLRALVRVGRAEERDRQLLADAARARGRGRPAPRSAVSCGIAWRTTSTSSARIAGGEQRPAHGVRDGQDRGQAALRARPDLRQARAVAVAGRGCRRSSAQRGAVAGPGADRARRRSAGRPAGRSASSCAW